MRWLSLLLFLLGCIADPLPLPDAAPATFMEPERGSAGASDTGPLVRRRPPVEDVGRPVVELDARNLPSDARSADAEPRGDARVEDMVARDARVVDSEGVDGEPLDTGAADGLPNALLHGADAAVVDIDQRDPACVDPGWVPGDCAPGMGLHHDSRGQDHISAEVPIEYELSPPSSGPHRSQWARWGAYTYLPPQRWLHNLEHGGVALLYHPCADAVLVEALQELAGTRPEDATGPFRYVLTPYIGLPSAVGVVAWEWTYSANCLNPGEVSAFIDRRYRMAPEDFPHDGVYDTNWVGR